nr:DnaJ domain-containing protein [Natronocella acetinitrilica]
MLPWLRRLMGGGDAGATEGGKPLRGRYIQLWLEEDSGRMDGDVLRGNWRGWRLSRLSLGELEAILAVCEREDANSAALLKAYLERNHGRNTGPTSTAMSEAEARAILGVAQDADAETITQAHRRLIQRLHPDRGGSDALASRVNAAKRVLLGNRR